MLTGLQQLSPARGNTRMRHHATAAGLTSPPQTHREPRCHGTGSGSTSRSLPRPAVRRRGTPERAPLGPARLPAQPRRSRGPGGGSRLTHAVPDHQGRGGGRGAQAQPQQRQHRQRRPERRHLGQSHDPPAARGGAGHGGGTNQGRGSQTRRGLAAGAWPQGSLDSGFESRWFRSRPEIPNLPRFAAASRSPRDTQPGNPRGCCLRAAHVALHPLCPAVRWEWAGAHPGWFPPAAAGAWRSSRQEVFLSSERGRAFIGHPAFPAHCVARCKALPVSSQGMLLPAPPWWLGCSPAAVLVLLTLALAIISLPGAGIHTNHADIAHLCPPWLCVLPFPCPTRPLQFLVSLSSVAAGIGS